MPELPLLAPVLGGIRMIEPDPPCVCGFAVVCACASNDAAHVTAKIKTVFVIGLMVRRSSYRPPETYMGSDRFAASENAPQKTCGLALSADEKNRPGSKRN